jgi:serine/threonine protein kinase
MATVRRVVVHGLGATLLKALDTSFRGTPRFEVRRRIGEGAVGVVYEAFDREHRTLVALKTLRHASPEGLLSLKREFRAAQNLRHENLVRLGEMFEADGVWFFTMELLSGLPLTEWIRAADGLLLPSALPANDGSGAPPTLARVRGAFRQLVSGLCALHAEGKVHRDVKPSNVLVTSEGRVVILDFGLASDALREASDDAIMGTAAYMAPEQALLEAVGPAADWYAVGVVLYQALTGRLPFQGAFEQIIEQKLTSRPLPPRELARDLPADLDALCLSLLRPDPGARPSGEQIAQVLGGAEARRSLRPAQQATFVGRGAELDTLLASFRDTRKGRGISVVVSGESGVGKSFLVRTFLEQLNVEDEDVLVLSGRCYERESVPYKAFDGIIDQLSQELTRMRPETVSVLFPPGTELLGRAFPVLQAVCPEPTSTGRSVENPQELRARVFAAMRGLFTRLAENWPLVLAIDDLQWADADSMALLQDIMRTPDEPELLLLATRRVGTGTERAGMTPSTIPGDVRFIDLHTLPYESAADLARKLLHAAGERGIDEEQVRRIVEDAKGHPLFIDELVRQRAMQQGAEVVKLDEALYRRICRLEPAAQRALELLAVAGAPISQEAAARAAAIDFAQLFDIATALRADALVRMSGAARDSLIEPYHDRIRESVLAHMAEGTQRDWHLRLATALEDASGADAESVAGHWLGAGHPARAAEHYLRAAVEASSAMAFERAARLYGVALEHGGFEPGKQRDVRRELATALCNGGLLPQAADIRLELARDADEIEALDQRRRAAEHLMCSGHYERGLELLRGSLAQIGAHNPRSRIAVLFALLFWRLVLSLRGMALAARRADRLRLLLRADVTWSAGNCYGMSDNVRGAYFMTRCLLASLNSGDPERSVRALGMAICNQSAGGMAASVRTGRMLERENALATELGTPEAQAYASGAQGFAHFNSGEFQAAMPYLDRSEMLFRDQCVGVSFELNSIRGILFRNLFALGELRELRARATPILNEARRQCDRYMIIICQSTAGALLATQTDEPEQAELAMRDACERLVQGVVHLQHYWAYTAECQVALYRGDAERAYAGMAWLAPALKRALLWRVAPCRILVTALQARTAVALAQTRRAQSEQYLVEAEGCAARLAREQERWVKPAASAILGTVALTRGQEAEASAHLAAAAAGYDAQHMKLYAAAARRLEGLARGGDDGTSLVRTADAAFAAENVLNPGRMTALLVGEPPGRRGAR